MCAYRQVVDNVVTECGLSFNGVACQECVVQPTLLPCDCGPYVDYGNCTEEIYWCYQLDCTNTDLGIKMNDCFWYHPIYTSHHPSFGCDESCSVCHDGIAPTNPNQLVNIESFAANGSFTCGTVSDMGMGGFFSMDECSTLQASLADECGYNPMVVDDNNDETNNNNDILSPTPEPTSSGFSYSSNFLLGWLIIGPIVTFEIDFVVSINQ